MRFLVLALVLASCAPSTEYSCAYPNNICVNFLAGYTNETAIESCRGTLSASRCTPGIARCVAVTVDSRTVEEVYYAPWDVGGAAEHCLLLGDRYEVSFEVP